MQIDIYHSAEKRHVSFGNKPKDKDVSRKRRYLKTKPTAESAESTRSQTETFFSPESILDLLSSKSDRGTSNRSHSPVDTGYSLKSKLARSDNSVTLQKLPLKRTDYASAKSEKTLLDKDASPLKPSSLLLRKRDKSPMRLLSRKRGSSPTKIHSEKADAAIINSGKLLSKSTNSVKKSSGSKTVKDTSVHVSLLNETISKTIMLIQF